MAAGLSAGCTAGGHAAGPPTTTGSGSGQLPTTTSGNHSVAGASPGCAAGNAAVRPGVRLEHLVVDGEHREYQIDIPPDYRGTKPFGLVLALHPLSVTYAYMPVLVRFASNTRRFDFVGVAPAGLLSGGKVPYWDAAPTRHNRDVDFVSRLIDHLEATLCLDPHEVFATGMSNGAQMSSLLGCRLAGKIDAIAPVEGEEFLAPCTGPPEPILAFHGTADPVLPYKGGGLNATTIASLYLWKGHPPAGLPKPLGIDTSMALWAKHNGCRPNPRTVRISSQVQKRTWTGCRAATVLYIIDGGGHGWAGQPMPGTNVFGFETTQIDATNLMMRFFFDHERNADLPRSPA